MKPGAVSGLEAVRIMLGALADAGVPMRRITWLERDVRARIARRPGGKGTGQDWISELARSIVEHDDKAADRGFQLGLRRIRETAAGRTRLS